MERSDPATLEREGTVSNVSTVWGCAQVLRTKGAQENRAKSSEQRSLEPKAYTTLLVNKAASLTREKTVEKHNISSRPPSGGFSCEISLSSTDLQLRAVSPALTTSITTAVLRRNGTAAQKQPSSLTTPTIFLQGICVKSKPKLQCTINHPTCSIRS